MPLLNNGQNSSQLQDFQHTFMQQWSNGQVNADWPPAVPALVTANGLTQAALEACIGSAFYPGIEAGGIPQGTPLSNRVYALEVWADTNTLITRELGALVDAMGDHRPAN